MSHSIFSHNDIQESASEVKSRRASSRKITRENFALSIGQGVLERLESDLDSSSHAFYQGENCVFVDVQGIDYIFKNEGELPRLLRK
jgi:hypothetical protein